MKQIQKILVANRGEIARRIIRTAQDMGIRTVAVYSDADRDAPFVTEADEAVRLPGTAATDTYLRADLVIAAATQVSADAVHPGYGFLAENADFARSCEEAGMTFIGPSPQAIAAMGSKIEARRLMVEAGLPVVPGTTIDGLTPQQATAAAEGLGLPVMIKASAGGGGKGMRIVTDAADLAPAIEGARREATSAFGDGTLFIERYVERPRHVEVQILGDHHGAVVHLGERECSIQRRHQKIIEETPSPAVDRPLRERMGNAAIGAARAVHYVGAGTVEFLLAPDGEFFFLEMNTRLQVEHAVTEMVTSVDLVREQIQIAEGAPISHGVLEATVTGHAIEARLYAEDAEGEFLPTTGTLHRFRISPPEAAAEAATLETRTRLRVDSGVEDGSEVSIHYDPMLAKIVVHARTRNEAARRLAALLASSQIHGVTTNRDLLVRILRHREFLDGITDTHFLDRHDPAVLARPLVAAEGDQLHAVAAALAGQQNARSASPVLGTTPSGWRNNPSQLQTVTFESRGARIGVGYRFTRNGLVVSRNGGPEAPAILRSCSMSSVELEIDGVLRCYSTHRVGDTWFVDSSLGSSTLHEQPRFPKAETHERPGSLLAPMPGKVIDVPVTEGDAVQSGDVVVTIEAMKMEHAVRSPQEGVVTGVQVRPGEQVEAGAVLVVVEQA